MHALSLPTWWIHITSVLEWALAMLLVQRWGQRRGEPIWSWLALAMLPALVSAMCACTWHLFDNPDGLRGLVTIQAGTTLLGNIALAAVAYVIWRQSRSPRHGAPTTIAGSQAAAVAPAIDTASP
ncbi:DUF2499 domain-containing protein [Synechococcus sp. GreenBA-s]|jgi:peptidoglycan/LPS O-acetylase OafA/YrhL|nr:DUF2499 domain-containing protein [Synechococcus sp. GreenBA-s]